MADDRTNEDVQPKDAGRRALLKAATVAGGAVAASALLPGSWKKPAATIGGLPAHAQTSQDIRIGFPLARLEGAPDMAATNGTVQIRAYCKYDDALGDFDGTHSVTYWMGPSYNYSDASADSCLGQSTFPLSQLGAQFGGTKFSGDVTFFVNTTCFPVGSIAWYVHKGAGHVSNVINASIGMAPA